MTVIDDRILTDSHPKRYITLLQAFGATLCLNASHCTDEAGRNGANRQGLLFVFTTA